MPLGMLSRDIQSYVFLLVVGYIEFWSFLPSWCTPPVACISVFPWLNIFFILLLPNTPPPPRFLYPKWPFPYWIRTPFLTVPLRFSPDPAEQTGHGIQVPWPLDHNVLENTGRIRTGDPPWPWPASPFGSEPNPRCTVSLTPPSGYRYPDPIFSFCFALAPIGRKHFAYWSIFTSKISGDNFFKKFPLYVLGAIVWLSCLSCPSAVCYVREVLTFIWKEHVWWINK